MSKIRNDTNVKFPDEWDKNDQYIIKYFNKCAPYTSTTEDMLNLINISIFYRLYCGFLFLMSVTSAVLAVIFRNKIKIIKSNIILIMFYTAGCLACTINSYFIQTRYSTYPCVAYFYLTSIGYPMVIITSFGCIINYLKQCYFSVFLYDKAINNQEKKRRSILHRICEIYTQSRLLNFLLTFVIIQLLYSLYISYTTDDYSLINIKRGFCRFTIEYLPQIILVCLFLFASFPLIVYQFYRLHDKFKFVNTLMINLVIMSVSAGLFIVALAVPSYNCSQIVRYLPSDAFALIVSCSFNYSQVIGPLLNYYLVNRRAKELEISKNGLIKLLKDDALFREFFEHCKQKCCVENALFHIEYTRFKEATTTFLKRQKGGDLSFSSIRFTKSSRALNANMSAESLPSDRRPVGISHTRSNSNMDMDNIDIKEHRSLFDMFNRSEQDSINSRDERKKTSIYGDVHNLANEIYVNFIDDNAKYEINIPEKIAKQIKNNLLQHNKQYNSERNTQLSEEGLDIENIFDEAHEIVLQDLYLNVYTEFISARNRQNQNQNKSAKAKGKNSVSNTSSDFIAQSNKIYD